MDTVIENIYICDCGQVLITKDTEATCTNCNSEMETAGWCESGGTARINVENNLH